MNETVDPDSIAETRPAPLAPPLAPARKRSRLGKRALLFFLAAALLASGLYFEKLGTSTTIDPTRNTRAAGPPPQTVRVAEVVAGDMPITIDALGTVTPLATVTVKTQIAGRLMSVGFQEGQLVREGDFLAQIDPRPYEAALAQVQAQLAKDTALHDQALADLARYKNLVKQDSIARQQVDDQQFLVAQDAAAMANDQAQNDTAKLNVFYTHIVSPIKGRVGLRLVDTGNYIQPSDPTGIVVITQLDPISVVFSTPEDNLQRITQRLNAGAKLPVTAFDRANVKQLAVGELTTYDNQVDTTTGTVKFRATFANPDNVLFPNQFVNVRLLVDTVKAAAVVPNAAIQLGAAGSFVYVVKGDDTVSVRQVVTGPADTTRTVISQGLSLGEKVVVDGVDRLREGAKVKVAAPPAGNAGGGSGAAHSERAPEGTAQHQRRNRKADEGIPTQGATAASPNPAPGPPPSAAP
jgi:multidrug efflux system membrane fusion protein